MAAAAGRLGHAEIARRFGVRAPRSISTSALLDEGVVAIRDAVRSGAVTATRVAEEAVARSAASQGRLNAWVTLAGEVAVEEARAVDARLARGEAVGALAGVPLGIKDNLATAGMRTTAGSAVLGNYLPARDATAVARARAAGAVTIGKTNMDEFGMGSRGTASAFGATRNPSDPSRVPGGSSGGSAAAVAARCVPAALGSDTGGSVRLPASYVGCVGFKPSYGRISRSGLLAYASSLDVVGILTRGVPDAAAVAGALFGADPLDSTSHDGARGTGPGDGPPGGGFEALVHARLPGATDSLPLRGLRIGLVREALGSGEAGGGAGLGGDPAADGPALGGHAVVGEVLDAVRGTADLLERLGAEVREASIPSLASALPAYYLIAASEASSNLSRYDGLRYGAPVEAPELHGLFRETRGAGFGAEVKRRVLAGTFALSAGSVDAYYARACQVRTLVARDHERAFQGVDVLLLPSAPTVAPRLTASELGGRSTTDPAREAPLRTPADDATGASSGPSTLADYQADLMTVPASLCGLPAVSLPAPPPSAQLVAAPPLPVGVQLVGRRDGDAALLQVAAVLEAAMRG